MIFWLMCWCVFDVVCVVVYFGVVGLFIMMFGW